MTTRPGSASTARRRDGALEAFMAGILRRFFGPDDIRRTGCAENVLASQDRVAKLHTGERGALRSFAPARRGVQRPTGGIAGSTLQGLVGAKANVGLRGIDPALIEAELLQKDVRTDRHRPRQRQRRPFSRTVLRVGRKDGERSERRQYPSCHVAPGSTS